MQAIHRVSERNQMTTVVEHIEGRREVHGIVDSKSARSRESMR